MKFIHCADLHLDASFSLNNINESEARRREQINDLENLINFAVIKEVDLILIAGDLFDTAYPSRQCVEVVTDLFASTNAKIFIAPGNHDPFTQDSVYKKHKFPENVYIFQDERFIKQNFETQDGCGITVFGSAFTSASKKPIPLPAPDDFDPDRTNIILTHADLLPSGESKYFPITKNNIKNCGADYLALGHIHKPTEVLREGDTYYAYSGSLSGRDFKETGARGIIYAQTEKKNNKFIIKPIFEKISEYSFEIIKIDVTGCESSSQLLNLTENIINEYGFDEKVSLRIIFEGILEAEPDFSILKRSPAAGKLRTFEFENDLVKFNLEYLESDPTIKGEFYAQLKPMLDSADENEREIAKKALKYGLSALNGNDVVDFGDYISGL